MPTKSAAKVQSWLKLFLTRASCQSATLRIAAFTTRGSTFPDRFDASGPGSPGESPTTACLSFEVSCACAWLTQERTENIHASLTVVERNDRKFMKRRRSAKEVFNINIVTAFMASKSAEQSCNDRVFLGSRNQLQGRNCRNLGRLVQSKVGFNMVLLSILCAGREFLADGWRWFEPLPIRGFEVQLPMKRARNMRVIARAVSVRFTRGTKDEAE